MRGRKDILQVVGNDIPFRLDDVFLSLKTLEQLPANPFALARTISLGGINPIEPVFNEEFPSFFYGGEFFR